MAQHGKRTRNLKKGLEAGKRYAPEDALQKAKTLATAKFDETIELVVGLNINPKKDQGIRGAVQLPAGTGKSVRVAVFARGPKAKEATEAGADIVGAEDLMETIEGGKVDFECCIATPDMMSLVGRLGRVLGPKKLMPNPKLGTVTMAVGEAVKAAKGGQIQYRNDGQLVHAPLGKASFSKEDLHKNLNAFMDALIKVAPNSKTHFIKNAYISSTMGPSLQLETSSAWEERS